MISSHTTPYGSNPEDGVRDLEFNMPDPALRKIRCRFAGCYRDAHRESQSDECVLHTLIGWEDELKRNQFDMEIQAEVAAWRIRAAKEMG
jgi:hypothetical protein